LDEDRRGILLQFLFESNLIKAIDPIIILRRADLSSASLGFIDLRGTNLNSNDEIKDGVKLERTGHE
jgi:uncharacterized protein YjbI with pentapeptide repeats